MRQGGICDSRTNTGCVHVCDVQRNAWKIDASDVGHVLKILGLGHVAVSVRQDHLECGHGLALAVVDYRDAANRLVCRKRSGCVQIATRRRNRLGDPEGSVTPASERVIEHFTTGTEGEIAVDPHELAC
jgi:hypothetical protein